MSGVTYTLVKKVLKEEFKGGEYKEGYLRGVRRELGGSLKVSPYVRSIVKSNSKGA